MRTPAICCLLLALLQPLPTFTGALQRIDAKTIVLKLDDYRELEFRRTRKTRFIGGADPAKLKQGDRLAIEASGDIAGGLTAVTVQLEKRTPPPAMVCYKGTYENRLPSPDSLRGGRGAGPQAPRRQYPGV